MVCDQAAYEIGRKLHAFHLLVIEVVLIGAVDERHRACPHYVRCYFVLMYSFVTGECILHLSSCLPMVKNALVND